MKFHRIGWQWPEPVRSNEPYGLKDFFYSVVIIGALVAALILAEGF